MRTHKDERKKESPPTVGKPETPTNPILVSIESLVECGPVRTREKKTEHDEERDWVIHSTQSPKGSVRSNANASKKKEEKSKRTIRHSSVVKSHQRLEKAQSGPMRTHRKIKRKRVRGR